MSEYQGSGGPATDAAGEPVIDPTRNVLDLVAAAVERLDDLRLADEKLRASDAEHLREMLRVRAEHYRDLRAAETQRIDAIRGVDVAANQQARLDAEVRATALAKQVTDSAEAMRSQVAATATAAATSLAAALVPIQERLAELTRLQYEQQGQKAQVAEGRAGGQYAIGAGGLVIAIISVLAAIYFAAHRMPTNSPSSSPTVVCSATYHPSPCP